MDVLDGAHQVPHGREIKSRPGRHYQIRISCLLARKMGGDDERGASTSRFGQGARAGLGHHDVGAPQPVGHIAHVPFDNQAGRPGPMPEPS